MAPQVLSLARIYRERRLMFHLLHTEKAAVMVHSYPGNDWQTLRSFSLLHDVCGVIRTSTVVWTFLMFDSVMILSERGNSHQRQHSSQR